MTEAKTSLRLPGILGELARRGHGGAALILAEAWGGTKHYISDLPGSALVRLIGAAAASVVAEKLRGEQHDIPNAKGLDSLKGRILEHPGTTRETAVALGCHERYVRYVRNAGAPAPKRTRPADERQLSLLP
ncbi:MAG: hypothetical protein HQL34_12995 [Alphaproteobacteria bacterium]|nr:hypothetical protein [Alphaproteobacteria bacterium]